MNFRSPIRKVSSLGSAKEGTSHWLMQRTSAVALIFLTIWLLFSFLQMNMNIVEPYILSPAEARYLYIDWINSSINAVMIILFIIAMFYHGALGIRVVLEDYVHNEFIKITAIIFVNLISFAASSIGIFSVLSMYFKG